MDEKNARKRKAYDDDNFAEALTSSSIPKEFNGVKKLKANGSEKGDGKIKSDWTASLPSIEAFFKDKFSSKIQSTAALAALSLPANKESNTSSSSKAAKEKLNEALFSNNSDASRSLSVKCNKTIKNAATDENKSDKRFVPFSILKKAFEIVAELDSKLIAIGIIPPGSLDEELNESGEILRKQIVINV